MRDFVASRRSFLGGVLALTAAATIPLASAGAAPLIVGDGIHDDTAGLQALFDGKPFRIAGEGIAYRLRDGEAFFSGGTFRVSKTLHLRPGSPRITVHSITLRCADAFDGGPMLMFHEGSGGGRFGSMTLESASAPRGYGVLLGNT